MKKSFPLPLLLAPVALLAALVAGCGGGGGSAFDTISISASSTAIAAGQTSQLQATELAASDNAATNVTNSVTWASSNPAVATVSATGLLTGLTQGTSTISAVRKKASGSLNLGIGAAVVTKISLSPSNAAVFTGGQQQFKATAGYSNGTSGDVTSKATWSVSPASAAAISSAGLLKALAAGGFTVSSNIGTVSATTTGTVSNPTLTAISVSPASARMVPGKSQQFKAVGTYNDKSTKDLTAGVTWTSSNTNALTISASGLALANTVNASTVVTVTAKVSSFTASSLVNVTPQATLTSMQVRPTSSSIAQGTAEQHTAIAFYSDGTQQDVTNQATWSVAASSLNSKNRSATGSLALDRDASPLAAASSTITVDQTGVDTAAQPGAASVQATLGAIHSESVVLVTNATVKSIGISSPELLIPVKARQQFKLTGWFSDGSAQDLTLTGNWLSSNPAVATIDNAGVVTAVSAGSVTFRAGFGGLSTSVASVRIISADLVSTIIKLPFPVLGNGATEAASVVGTFSDGTQQDLTPLATWQSSNTNSILISESGLIQTSDPGVAQITATVDGVSSEATIVAVDATLLSITVLPVNPSFALGSSLQFTALAYFTNGAQSDLSDAVLWTSSDPNVLTIDSSGRAKSGSVGSTTVTASLVGVTGASTTIQVTGATLTGLTLIPASAQIAEQTHTQYTATGWFNDGSIQDLTNDVLWSVSDPALASVDVDGTVLGLSPGSTHVIATAQPILGDALVATEPLIVTNAQLVSTVIAPGAIELPIGVQRQLILQGMFSDGTMQDMTADAIWQSPAPTVTFASPTGIAAGISPGIGTIAASVGNFSSATQITVANVSLTSISSHHRLPSSVLAVHS